MRNFRLLIFISLFFLSFPALAVSRDHLTEQEAGLVADTQELDKRIAVFIKAAERRFALIADPNVKQSEKDLEKFGPMPQGTRAELLSDIAKIIDESITNIENVSDRDPSNPLINKSLSKLADSCKTFLSQLSPMLEKAKDEKEIHAIELAIENAQMVVDAAQKLPPPAKGKPK
jgi:predicted transcriptional regulator